MFYYLGHMSKFAQPGSRRLKSHVTGVYQKGGGGPSTTIPGSLVAGYTDYTWIITIQVFGREWSTYAKQGEIVIWCVL